MSEIIVPVLLDRYENFDIAQAIMVIEGMVTDAKLALCQSSPETPSQGYW